VPYVLRIYHFRCGPCLLSVSCVQCFPCLSFLVECVSSFCVLCPMFSVSIIFGAVRVFFLRLVPNVLLVYLFWWSVLSSFCVLCPMFSVSIFFGEVRVFFLCLVSHVTRVYLFWWSVCLLSTSCAQCSPCLSFQVGSVSSFCVLYPMLPVAIFFDGVRVFFLRLVPNVTRDYLFLMLYVSSFCVLYLMISVFFFKDGPHQKR
jgi:hypothetical protein